MSTTRAGVSIERSNGIFRIVLDRPPVNVLDIPTMKELEGVLAEANEAPDARVVLLTGAGKAFCAGVDVADHAEERAGEMLEAFHGVVHRLLEIEPPVVAAVNGAALGGGCELVLAADVVLGRAGATLGQPEIRLGLLPPVAAVLLPRLVGSQVALDLILSGRSVDMNEARRMGLVSKVLPGDRFEEEVGEYVETLASFSGAVLRVAKRTVRTVAEVPLSEGLGRADEIYRDELMALRDPHEGLAAFLEKREPVWRHA